MTPEALKTTIAGGSQLLKDHGLVDKLGRGLQKIMRYYATEKLPPPAFDESGAFFRVAVTPANQV